MIRRIFLATAVLLAGHMLCAQANDTSIVEQLKKLRSYDGEQRPIATIQVAESIRALPAGQRKVQLAASVANLVTEGDQGPKALQAVAETLAMALKESPIPARGNEVPPPYIELANLVRYMHVKVALNDPLLARATEILVSEEADVQKADFTLKDLHNKKVTLSELRGKIVMVNFWATWCGPCRLEMPALNKIYAYFQSQGLVILSITDEDAFKVNSFIQPTGYRPPVLIDPGGKVHKQFHVEGIPKTFFFSRDGKLIGETIDQSTEKQFLSVLSQTDLHP